MSREPEMRERTPLPRSDVVVCVLVFVLLGSVRTAHGATLVRTKTIVNVGGTGSYDEVHGMACDRGQLPICMKRQKPVGGCLSPFDEEQTLKLRGPMEISQIGVYYPSAGQTWDRVSFYDRRGTSDNLVFMGDYGRAYDGQSVDEQSCWTDGGDWHFVMNGDDFMCHGYNQSYVSADGKCARRAPEFFAGSLDDHVQVNVMQSAQCRNGDCGYYRGQGHHGWRGGQGGAKIFAVKARFPAGGRYNSPALWLLHASVVRTANHHPQLCNCRGLGAPGGCGEFDIAEVVEEQDRKEDLDTTVYTFKGAFSDQSAFTFDRPTARESVFVTILNAEGYVQVLQLDEFDFGGSIPASVVREWNSKRELIIKLPGEEMAGCGGPVCSHAPAARGAGFAARLQDGVSCTEPGSSQPGAFQPPQDSSPISEEHSYSQAPIPQGDPTSPPEPHTPEVQNDYPSSTALSNGGHSDQNPQPVGQFIDYDYGYTSLQLQAGGARDGYQQYPWYQPPHAPPSLPTPMLPSVPSSIGQWQGEAGPPPDNVSQGTDTASVITYRSEDLSPIARRLLSNKC